MASTKFNNFIKKMRETTGSTSFKESRYGEVKHWISTGSYALNRILSGSIYKGIPSGKVVLISGENSTGKSLISAKIMANALNEGFDHIFYFDSEGGALRDFFENVGCDTEKIEQILVQSVEEAQLQILNVYNMIQEFKEKNPDEDVKFLCVLDSLGALVAEKVTRDADKGKVASEMGGRAKLCLPGDTLVYMADGTYKLLKDIDISKIDNNSKKFNRKFVVVPVYMAKGLEFDSVIIYTDRDNKYSDSEKYLYYVAITRAQHKLIVYNQ
jgi:archaellum biogenesis ATPase FlaH